MGKQTILNGANVVANLCLYGTSRTGAGFILEVKPGLVSTDVARQLFTLGDGSTQEGRTFTAAIYTAVEALAAQGIRQGILRIFHPGGEFLSAVDLAKAVPNYGSLKSVPNGASHLVITTVG